MKDVMDIGVEEIKADRARALANAMIALFRNEELVVAGAALGMATASWMFQYQPEMREEVCGRQCRAIRQFLAIYIVASEETDEITDEWH